jgi:uncharacterized protein (TIGR02271 family)
MIENENSRIVIGEGGWRGRLDALPHPDARYVVVHPEDREPALILPMDLFDQHQNGTFHIPLTRSDATTRSLDISSGRAWEGQKRGSVSAENGSGFGTEQIVVPIIEELIEVRKQMVDTANVRVTKTVHEHEETINEPLRRETVAVTRVPIERVVDTAMPPREEGDTLIIPVYEERLVVQKQLFLKEEVHLTRQGTVDREAQQTVTLRREEVAVERQSLDTLQDVQHNRSEAV